MSQIDLFNQGTASYSVDDFNEDSAAVSPVTSMGTNRNVAAHAALLAPKPDDIPQVFNQSFDELNGQGQSQTADTMLANAQGETLSGLRTAAADLLTDPTKPDEWKQAALESISNPQNTLFDPRAMVATRAASQPVDGESDESGQLRGTVAAAITNVIAYQREKQKFFNEMKLRESENPSATEWVNTAEMFTPGTLGFKQARAFSSLNDSTLGTIASFFLPGSSKAAMADKFNRLPLEDRQAVMENTMNMLSADGQTIFMPSAADQGNLAAFRDIVDEGSYTVTQETVDNLVGVLDVVGIGGFLAKFTKGGAAAADAASTGTRGGPRSPTPEDEWRTGSQRNPGTFDQNGNPSDPISQWERMTPEERSWSRRFTVSETQPTAPMETIKDVNPQMARNLHQAVEADTSGDLAGALYGTAREDAIAHDIAPQISSVDGRVQSKVHNAERDSDFRFMPDAEVLDFVDNSGASYLSPAEKRVLRGNAVNDFQNTTGLAARKEMMSVEDLPDGLSLKAVYGPTDSGWANAADAVDQAQFSLRKYGIEPGNIQILARQADEYVPVSMEQAASLGQGDYLLQINHTHKFNIADMADEGWEAFDVKNNILDEWAKGTGKGAQGSLASNMLDPQSMLNFGLTKGATVSTARAAQTEARMGKLAENYIRSVKVLDKTEQQRLFEAIRQNNVKGQSFNYTDMVAEGYSQNAIKAAESWKVAQDTMYELTNRDLVKSYRSRGYGVMEHQDSGTRLFVKELNRTQLAGDIRVYEPVKGEVRPMTKEQISAHYDANGNIGKMHTPMTVDKQSVEYVLNTNKAGSTYVRALKDTDHVLSYRKGYYAVKYDNPHFIEQRLVDDAGRPILDENGKQAWKTVATADTVPNANRARQRLAAVRGGNWETDFRYRADLKGDGYDQAVISHMQAGGMSAQKVRGQRLEEALGENNISNQVNIENPINSLIHSASSIANRVAFRDWLETAKARFMAQYSDVLPRAQGQVKFPASRSEIGEAGISSKMATDARTTWEYIRSMENGYQNSIDAGYRAMFNTMADLVGTRGFGNTERAIRSVAAGRGPTGAVKSLAFNLMLALNPLRQFLVQSHQAIMLTASFPTYTASRMVPDLAIVMTKHLAEGKNVKIPDNFFTQWGRTPEQAEAMFQALKKSGIADGIKAHELVREGMNSLADGSAYTAAQMGTSALRTATAPLRTTLKVARKVGFDMGEYLSSSASFLAHYDDALKRGVKMDAAGIEDTFAKSRNYVYNMDRAGAMPYNHNNLAMFTQFLQVPHKAITQLLFNRGISSKQRFAMSAFMGAMFGPTAVVGLVPGTGDAMEAFFHDLFPEDPTTRNALRTGLESVMLNNFFTSLYGEEVNLDYKSLAPLDAYGLTEFVQTAFDEGITKVVTNSPGGSLLFGSNPRVMQVLSTFGSLMGMGPAKEKDPTTVGNMFMDIANLSSGFSNAYKAKQALEYGRKIGALGGTTDGTVNSFEAIAQAFGIPTADQEASRKILDSTWKSQEAFDNDVKQTFNKYAKIITQDGLTADQFEYAIKMAESEMSAYGNNQRAAEVWNQQLKKQQSNGDYRIIDKVMEMSGWAKKSDVNRLIDQAPGITEEQRNNLRALTDYNFSMRDDKGE